ncbi:MAG TPA: DUF3830 family protein [Vicinamibacterales bacterium]|jgi:hypothetical protein
MSGVVISSGSFRFVARFETEATARTCEAFLKLLPFSNRLVRVRWSGEAVSAAEQLRELGEAALWHGARPIVIDRAQPAG